VSRMQKIQIIKKNIDENRLNGKNGDERIYYNNLRRTISNSLNREADIVLINLIPKEPIKERWLVEMLLDLQGEFTKTAILPKTNIKFHDGELLELQKYFKINSILESIY